MSPFPPLLGAIHIAHPEELGLFAAVAVVAVVGIYFLLRLTFRGARSFGRTAPLPAKPYRRVLLPALDEITYAPEAVALACRLATPPTGGAPDASVLLTYIIEVPRSLAADAPMPDEEALANRALAEASESVRRCGLRPVPQVRKGRGAVDETLRAIREGNADLLVLVAPPGAASADAFGRLTAELSRRAPCEVILARAQPA